MACTLSKIYGRIGEHNNYRDLRQHNQKQPNFGQKTKVADKITFFNLENQC